jgi:5-oxoprolinase (ATP-hydrolysing)/N-methylhydantoinase B
LSGASPQTGIGPGVNATWCRARAVKELYGKVSSSKFANVRFEPGDPIKLTTPGGGGYSEPAERDREAVRKDVRERYVSEEAARELYRLE